MVYKTVVQCIVGPSVQYSWSIISAVQWRIMSAVQNFLTLSGALAPTLFSSSSFLKIPKMKLLNYSSSSSSKFLAIMFFSKQFSEFKFPVNAVWNMAVILMKIWIKDMDEEATMMMIKGKADMPMFHLCLASDPSNSPNGTQLNSNQLKPMH